jgi:hypothetical protein
MDLIRKVKYVNEIYQCEKDMIDAETYKFDL